MLTPSANPSFLEYFGDLPEVRIDRSKKHELIDIITIAILATICGAEHFTEMETFGKAKKTWLKTFLKLENGIPSHDTIAEFLPESNRRSFKNASSDGFNPCKQRSTAKSLGLTERQPVVLTIKNPESGLSIWSVPGHLEIVSFRDKSK
jgi:hypothetical protein